MAPGRIIIVTPHSGGPSLTVSGAGASDSPLTVDLTSSRRISHRLCHLIAAAITDTIETGQVTIRGGDHHVRRSVTAYLRAAGIEATELGAAATTEHSRAYDRRGNVRPADARYTACADSGMTGGDLR
jgi:hypothetical protein